MEEQKLEPIQPILTLLRKRFEETRVKIHALPAKTSKGYKVAVAEREAADKALEDFMTFAQSYLNERPPRHPHYLEKSFGLMLADGQVVSIIEGQEPEPMQDCGVHITRPRSLYGQGGMQVDDSVPVTK